MVTYLTDDSFLEPQGQPFINGCFNWMLPNLNIENGCFTKHPFISGCLGFKVVIVFSCLERAIDSTGHLQKKHQQKNSRVGLRSSPKGYTGNWRCLGSYTINSAVSQKKQVFSQAHTIPL